MNVMIDAVKFKTRLKAYGNKNIIETSMSLQSDNISRPRFHLMFTLSEDIVSCGSWQITEFLKASKLYLKIVAMMLYDERLV